MKMTMAQAINLALAQEMVRDPSIVLLGEDVGIDGGVFRVTEGLYERFGRSRVIDTPLSEPGIVGTAIGMSAFGLRAVAEMQFQGFVHNAYYQVCQHMSRLRNRTRGAFRAPMVLRLPYSGGIRALEHHGESSESLFIHVPGLQVVCPSTPKDAKGMMAAALASEDPVVFFEPKRIYRAFKEEVPEERYEIPLDGAATIREGSDLTLVSWGAMTFVAKDAVDEAAKQGISVEHIDLRVLSPCDYDAIIGSVRKTGRCVIVHEAPKTLGFGAEIAARLVEKAFLHLEAPIKRVTGWDIIIPYPKSEELYFPDKGRILKAIDETVHY